MYRALNREGNIFRLRGEFEKSKILYQRAEKLAVKLDNPVLRAIIKGNIGNIYLKQHDYLKAAQHYSNALSVFQEENDAEGEARMLSSLGSINLTIGNQDIALEYYQKSIKLYESQGEKATESIAMNTMNIGLIQFEQEQLEKSKTSFENALRIIETEDIKYLESGCYSILALIYLKLDQLQNAEIYARKNLELNRELKIQHEVTDAQIILSQVIFRTDVPKATKQAEEILTYLPLGTSHSSKKELYELLYQCYKHQDKLDLSLEMLEISNKYNDSIQLKKNSFAVARELVRSDYESQLNENKLNDEKEKEQLRSAQFEKTVRIVSIFIVLVVSILIYFISKERKNKRRRNVLLAEIEDLKSTKNEDAIIDSNKFTLSREKIEI